MDPYHDGYSETERQLLRDINVATCIVSIASSGLIFLLALITGCRARFTLGHWGLLASHRFVVMLALSDIGFSWAYFIGYPDDGSFECYAQAIMGQFFGLTSLGWVLAIALSLWGTNVRGWTEGTDTRYFLRSLAAILVLAGALTAVPADDYGQAGLWCWIRREKNGNLLRYLCFFAPLWLGIALISFLYAQLVRHLIKLFELDRTQICCSSLKTVISVLFCPRNRDDVHQSAILGKIRQLCLFPVVLTAGWILPTINRVHDSLHPDHPVLWLAAAALGSSNLIGLLNVMVYGIGFRRQLWNTCFGSNENSVDNVLDDAFQAEETDSPRQVSVGPNPIRCSIISEKESTVVL